ncbi:hypothetical protein AXF42_Ash014196 [Apostasia shenzhenica]|uniref:Uncharacterized protein n=1 Tax=Apostasia shenzhenica TaxID=1088818 RepID=A0A2I0A180_9ASPA|nr:hypothetical protein AXF42_Ash014196 [Apostasia shenzhenica]
MTIALFATKARSMGRLESSMTRKRELGTSGVRRDAEVRSCVMRVPGRNFSCCANSWMNGDGKPVNSRGTRTKWYGLGKFCISECMWVKATGVEDDRECRQLYTSSHGTNDSHMLELLTQARCRTCADQSEVVDVNKQFRRTETDQEGGEARGGRRKGKTFFFHSK